MTCSNKPTEAIALQAALARLDQPTIDHPYYQEVRLGLEERLDSHDLVLVVGPSGVGKGRLVLKEVERFNKPILDDLRRLRAVFFTTPSPQRGSFAWSALWDRWLRALGDPLPECKVDREFKKRRLSEGVSIQARRGSVDALRNAAFAATRDRGVEVVFIDEAANLVPKERARTLRDQLDVLRDLTDNGCCKIVLVSTGRILEPLNLSGELARRVGEVYFPRYADARVSSDEYKSFASVVRTFRDRLPEASRQAVRGRVQLLHAGSLGCVGILYDWFDRAIRLCLRQEQGVLGFDHFKATVLTDKKLETLRAQAREFDEAYPGLTARTFGGLLEASGQPHAPVASSSSAPSGSPASARRRAGTPKPRRHVVGA